MLNIANLTFHYPTSEFSLHIPSLDVKTGTKLAIIGPSGCGKTTLLHLIAGIQTTNQGMIQVNGQTINQLSDGDRRRFRITNIGFIFQDFALLDYLNVLDNILHPFRLNPALKLTPETRQVAIALAQKMGIQDKLKRPSKLLSQGERQRVAICRSLVTQPPLLLADEATGNLDPTNKTLILQALFEYVDQQQAMLLAVTHDHELLPQFDQVVDLNQFVSAPLLAS
ncbi:MAG: ATP-binding cassette domain-containing protein [Synechocystis sp.]|nr:ATP-binding cassette domain-containing protein [Synechocystis sp.]